MFPKKIIKNKKLQIVFISTEIPSTALSGAGYVSPSKASGYTESQFLKNSRREYIFFKNCRYSFDKLSKEYPTALRWGFFIFLFVFPISCLATDMVEINTATISQLDKITGIGPVLAERIIEARPFSSVDDLIRVKGIGEKTLQKIKEQGLACVGCEQTQNSNIQTPNPNQIQNQQILNNNGYATEATEDKKPTEQLPAIICPSMVFINEILPSPNGPDDKEEWIEIFNQNDKETNLSGLAIKDTEGKTTNYIFPQNTKIPPISYLVLKRETTKIILNNDKDKLEIFCQEKIIDSVSYQNAKTEQSYNRIGNEWKWSEVLTPDAKNIINLANNNAKKENSTETGSLFSENWEEKGLANMGVNSNLLKKKLFTGAIAIFTALFSAIMIFTLKKALKQNKY